MKKRNIWIPITAALLALAAIAAMILVPRLPKDEAAVFPVTMVGYTDYYSGSTESYGMVTTDKVQTLYLSQSQTVTEILVYPGQSVKKGDVLFTYDTTLSDLAVERKDLANKQLEMELKTAQAELNALKNMKPIVYKPGTNTTAKTDYTKSPADKTKLNTVYSTNTSGVSSKRPLYFWLGSGKQVDEAIIDYLFTQATGSPNRIYVVFQSTPADKTSTAFSSHYGVSFTKNYVTVPEIPTETTHPEETTRPGETTVPPTTEPTEPAPIDTNPLTGEALEEITDNRPLAIMINNTSKAVPQCGISKADLMYEIIAEGSVTRFMAFFYDLSDVDVLGPVRSVRPYFVRMAQNYGAFLSSAGGSDEAIDLIKSMGYDYLNGIAGAGNAFYRDQWRRENRGFEHSLMTTGEKLMKAAEKAGIQTTMEDRDYGFHFTAEPMTAGEDASELTIWFYKNGKKTTMRYDAETGLFAMSQHGAASVDGNDDSPITFRNVVVLEANTKVKDKKGHLEVQTTGTGTGYYARDGKLVQIKWSRESNSADFVYTDAQGNPISFGVGKTYIAIVPDGSPFSFT